MTNQEIKEKLETLKEEEYRQFIIKLLPGVEKILGVRIPKLRTLSKRIESLPYLELPPSFESFEEIMLQGFVLLFNKSFILVPLYFSQI